MLAPPAKYLRARLLILIHAPRLGARFGPSGGNSQLRQKPLCDDDVCDEDCNHPKPLRHDLAPSQLLTLVYARISLGTNSLRPDCNKLSPTKAMKDTSRAHPVSERRRHRNETSGDQLASKKGR